MMMMMIQVPGVTQCADGARSTLAERHGGGGGEDVVARHAGRGDAVLHPPRDDEPAGTPGRRGDGGEAVKLT